MVDNSAVYGSSRKGGARGARLHLQLMLAMVPIMVIIYLTVAVQSHQFHVGTQKLCGQALSDTLDVVCIFGYNTMPMATPEPYALSPLLSNFYGTEVLIKTRRQRRQGGRGIYDECCRNSCSYAELAAYCLQPPTNKDDKESKQKRQQR
ncbi:uncharacterized protein Dwil_GK10979 [Drosophila willistoni]|uniref:Insulin-like domain-containing protein n=1 Tax=Drosophila willistoni TaxID=7260 RepID=B4N494_DROWI|nr:probable insulin-like peptide 1 [Drosophila willistoni]EDW78968.1 uncharacterized protein Dwil_GK10979 [Drosophila willistoni]